MTLAGLSIRRPVATTMLMISVMFIGLMAMFSMKSELLPNMNIPVVTVRTTWQGAVAEDVETQVTKKIEEILPNVEGIDKIESTSTYGQSTIVVKFDYGINADEKVTEIQRELSKITNDLPSAADTPIAKKVEAGTGNLTLVIMMSAPNKAELSSFVEEYLKPKFESLPGIGQVNVFGNPDKQLQIQIDSDKLAAYDLSPMELYDMIRVSSLNVPLGTVSTGTKDVIVRFMGELNYIDTFEDMIIKSNGNTLRVKDVADVVFTTEDPEDISYLSGKESIAVIVEKSSDGSTIDLNKRALEALESLESIMPPDTVYNVLLDTSIDINRSISNVSSTAVQGLILATIVLYLFLKNMRATLLVSAALPVAVIFTFAFLALNGTSLNLISLMGLSIGVGMLTDNSVVVVDNIYRHMTELKSPVMEASDNATTEVAMSVIASALTTMVVFIPILFIPGIAREIFRDLAYSIIFSNLAAIIVSLTLIPMLASRFLTNKADITKEGKIFGTVKSKYLKLINWAVNNRWKTIGITIFVFVFSIGIVPKFLKMEFMPKQDQGRYSIVAELGKGLDLEKSKAIAKEIENIVINDPNTQSYFTIVQKDSFSINVDIGKKDTRDTSVFDIITKLRPIVEKIPDTRTNLSEDFAMGSQQRDVQFDIVGSNLNEIKEVGAKVLEEIKKYPGAVDVKSTLDPGNIEARVVLDRDKIKSYGINPSVIAQTLSYSVLGGDRGDTVTVKTGVEEIDVIVRLPKDKRNDINALKNLNIKIDSGKFIKLSDVADIVMAEGSSEINKTDRIYSVTVSANDGGVGMKAIQDKLVEAYKSTNPPKSVDYRWGGNSENLSDATSQLGFALGISIFLIYALLAAQFENFVLPVIIIGSIPLALVGIVWGLLLTGQPVDIMVMIGVILLAGVVVNNAIVLIDFIKMTRERGSERQEAVIESCRTRLRPILMTTMTTVLGMLPLSLGIGEGSEIYRGMAITVMFGLTFSTLLTLVVIPILYTLIEDMNNAILKFLKKVYNKIMDLLPKKLSGRN
ncbi:MULTISPECIES: efflux RND transporter permease subunit [Fusobacterium]|jgi:HAE1 family hydrophobic/amphiphilic exporter-1|uniref:efflux RND transporter permease subunit n=1 Tax=Fusobacterium TaxID=848 RepID=UPI000E9746F5|nr:MULTISPECIES: efflux RND transporter permease subunit [Fusobacterium]MCF0170626.1 efflux RND transporter permease subunit [Fusobacterium varium]MCF2672918.1 efflux RND transporter permease subunit [Fusobacterium varium]UYI78282.1 MAG: efflux RND transporter permease subunit [Fusobacterium varium]HBJ78051.1 AcrB/AcrD/AcrF family protein [Fusobacterium sp.]